MYINSINKILMMILMNIIYCSLNLKVVTDLKSSVN